MTLSDVCLSDAYIRPKLRTERPRKTKIGTEIAHVTRDSDTTLKVKGQGHQAALLTDCWRVRHGRGNVLVVGMLLLRYRLLDGAKALRQERGGSISWRPPTYSLLYLSLVLVDLELPRPTCRWGGPVRTKSHQNESIFRCKRTKNFVLMGVRSDGISFCRAVIMPSPDLGFKD